MSLALAALALAATPLNFESCRIGTADGITMPAECATLEVAENRADPGGRRITLSIAKVAAFRGSSLPPLVFIAGGPGQSALESFPQVAAAFGEVRKTRDILLVDQRGTGGSNPLQCAPLQDAEMTMDFDAAQARSEAARCAESLDADLRFYTTLDAVQDLEEVRAALGAEQLALYGISYGTRVAQEYLRRHPERVEKIILDGVVAAGEALGPRIGADAQAALEIMFERCAANTECAARFPDLRRRFSAFRARLERKPVTVEIRDPFTFETAEITLNWLRVAGLLRMYSYLPESVALLPLLLHQAETGDWQALAGSVLTLERQNENLLYIGMHNSVVCSEDAPFLAAAAEEPGYLGTVMTEFIAAMCEAWPQRELPKDMREPVVSGVPALLLSGEADPVTPPRNAEQVAEHLANSLHLVAPGQGHGVAWRGCAPRLVAEFLADGIEELDASCLDELRAYPFFIDANGPTP